MILLSAGLKFETGSEPYQVSRYYNILYVCKHCRFPYQCQAYRMHNIQWMWVWQIHFTLTHQRPLVVSDYDDLIYVKSILGKKILIRAKLMI